MRRLLSFRADRDGWGEYFSGVGAEEAARAREARGPLTQTSSRDEALVPGSGAKGVGKGAGGVTEALTSA